MLYDSKYNHNHLKYYIYIYIYIYIYSEHPMGYSKLYAHINTTNILLWMIVLCIVITKNALFINIM